MDNRTQTLLAGATESGLLSQDSANLLNNDDLGHRIQAALGVPAMEFGSQDSFLLMMVIDDSSSMQPNEQAARDGHNLILESLRSSKQQDGILACGQLFNRGLLYPYSLLADVPALDDTNYHAEGRTPLYDMALQALGTQIAKAQEYAEQGITCRTFTVIITDGADVGSTHKAGDVKRLVEEMRHDENHIVCGMGIDDGYTDFRQVFRSMGIPDGWIRTPGNSPSEIRKAFQVVSQTALRATQTAQLGSLGGFGG